MNCPKLKPFPNDLANTRKALCHYDQPLRVMARNEAFDKVLDNKNSTDKDIKNAFDELEKAENKVREAFFEDTKSINSHDNCMKIGLDALRVWCKRVEDRLKAK